MDEHGSPVRDSRSLPPAEGASVVTIDGKRLGQVTANAPGHFKVHVRWGRDFWLSRELIRRHEPESVILNVSRGSIGGYKLRNPGVVASLHEEAGIAPPSPRDPGHLRETHADAPANTGDITRPNPHGPAHTGFGQVRTASHQEGVRKQ